MKKRPVIMAACSAACLMLLCGCPFVTFIAGHARVSYTTGYYADTMTDSGGAMQIDKEAEGHQISNITTRVAQSPYGQEIEADVPVDIAWKLESVAAAGSAGPTNAVTVPTSSTIQISPEMVQLLIGLIEDYQESRTNLPPVLPNRR